MPVSCYPDSDFRAFESGFYACFVIRLSDTAGADDAIGALIVSVLGTIVCSLGAMPMVYVSRNSDPTMAQLVLVLIAVLLQLAYMLVIVNVMPLCLFSVGYVVLVVVAIGISTGVFSRYFINTNIEL